MTPWNGAKSRRYASSVDIVPAPFETRNVAEPAGSQTLAKRYGLGVSSATIRSTMSELET